MLSVSPALPALIRLNREWLAQAAELIERLDEERYAAAGPHFRHIVEFYDCFLRGVTSGKIDYDGRSRERRLETSRESALERIATLRADLETVGEPGRPVMVKAEDAEGLGLADPWLASSVGRELQSLSGHTVHHFAIIALTLRPLGVALDPSFGVAPSTLRHGDRLCAR
ncbi:MAG: hypothetical protein SFV54_25900 [Bryobacteraceae bacterium]|nr:hypothetical protein [Bryobacteraceae bacterium]